MIPNIKEPSVTLYDLFANSLVASNIFPYLPPYGVLSVAATNKAFKALVTHTPGFFRHLDLASVKQAQIKTSRKHYRRGNSWRLEPDIDASARRQDLQSGVEITEDDFYADLMRNVFSHLRRKDILQNVHTLILDGLPGTSDLCFDIINSSEGYNVRFLSLRNTATLNEGKLQGALQYACRESRPRPRPRLQGLYLFGEREAEEDGPSASSAQPGGDSMESVLNQPNSAPSQTSSPESGAGDSWWSDQRKGQVIRRGISTDWAYCMLACDGLIAFDAVLCKGPRHHNSPAYGSTRYSDPSASSTPAVATHSLKGCAGCGSAPEGVMSASSSPFQLPLLSPPPVHASTISAATCPQTTGDAFVPRCKDCLWERWCKSCNQWWCENCYPNASDPVDDSQGAAGLSLSDDARTRDIHAVMKHPGLSKSCWECGFSCRTCVAKTQRTCQKCRSGYCIVHNEGSNENHCDWCVTRGRGLKRDRSTRLPYPLQFQRARLMIRDDGSRLVNCSG